MPPKRASNKKLHTKLAVASLAADAEILNNGVKELGEVISVDSKSMTNGSENLEADLQETTNAKVTKRSTGRGKATAPTESEQQMIVDKKPAAKGRGKKKTNEIEVIQNENELEQEAKEEVAEAEAVEEKQAVDEIVTKPKGKGKKSEMKTKKIKSSKTNEKIQNAEEVQEELMTEAEISAVEKPGKKSKVVAKRKKQDTNEKQIESEEAKQEEIIEEPIEKGMQFV